MIKKIFLMVACMMNISGVVAQSVECTMQVESLEVNETIHCVFDESNQWHYHYKELDMSARLFDEEDQAKICMEIAGKHEELENDSVLITTPVFLTPWGTPAELSFVGESATVKLTVLPLK